MSFLKLFYEDDGKTLAVVRTVAIVVGIMLFFVVVYIMTRWFLKNRRSDATDIAAAEWDSESEDFYYEAEGPSHASVQEDKLDYEEALVTSRYKAWQKENEEKMSRIEEQMDIESANYKEKLAEEKARAQSLEDDVDLDMDALLDDPIYLKPPRRQDH
jgi:hypothetical protein